MDSDFVLGSNFGQMLDAPNFAKEGPARWCIMGAMRKVRTNIYLNQRQKTLLDRVSAKTGAPVAELIRRAIDFYLRSRGKGAT
jgi:hypothetical protein